jgi:hypothetical protein
MSTMLRKSGLLFERMPRVSQFSRFCYDISATAPARLRGSVGGRILTPCPALPNNDHVAFRYPADHAYLLDRPEFVEHQEVISTCSGPGSGSTVSSRMWVAAEPIAPANGRRTFLGSSFSRTAPLLSSLQLALRRYIARRAPPLGRHADVWKPREGSAPEGIVVRIRRAALEDKRAAGVRVSHEDLGLRQKRAAQSSDELAKNLSFIRSVVGIDLSDGQCPPVWGGQ